MVAGTCGHEPRPAGGPSVPLRSCKLGPTCDTNAGARCVKPSLKKKKKISDPDRVQTRPGSNSCPAPQKGFSRGLAAHGRGGGILRRHRGRALCAPPPYKKARGERGGLTSLPRPPDSLSHLSSLSPLSLLSLPPTLSLISLSLPTPVNPPSRRPPLRRAPLHGTTPSAPQVNPLSPLVFPPLFSSSGSREGRQVAGGPCRALPPSF